jgi:hypothetical protein
MNRLKKWQIASSIFDGEGINNAAFAYSIMQLGQSEQLLIQLESKLYRHIKFGTYILNPITASEQCF